jgi:hypothetical protein
MRAKLGLLGLGCALATSLLAGCATSGGVAGRASVGEPAAATGAALEVPSVRVGEARVLDARVNPLVPIRLALEGGAIDVSFGRLGRGVSERIDPGSLEPRSTPSEEPARAGEGASPGPQRVVLDGGRFLVCWTTGSLEWGHRAMARMFNSSDGSPRGGAVVISPTSADVIGAPRAITSDGNRVVATFAAMSGSSFQLMAVPIDDASSDGSSDGAERSARAMIP